MFEIGKNSTSVGVFLPDGGWKAVGAVSCSAGINICPGRDASIPVNQKNLTFRYTSATLR